MNYASSSSSSSSSSSASSCSSSSAVASSAPASIYVCVDDNVYAAYFSALELSFVDFEWCCSRLLMFIVLMTNLRDIYFSFRKRVKLRDGSRSRSCESY